MYVDIDAARTSVVRKLQSAQYDLREIILVHPVLAKEKCTITQCYYTTVSLVRHAGARCSYAQRSGNGST